MSCYYSIGRLSTGDFRQVLAGGVREAKKIYARYYRIQVSRDLIARPWTAQVMSFHLIHDRRRSIDAYRAEEGYPVCEVDIMPPYINPSLIPVGVQA